MPAPDDLRLTDKVWHPEQSHRWLTRFFRPLLKDERDVGIMRTLVLLLLVIVVPGLLLFIPGFFRWWMAPIYWLLYIRHLGPFTLMLHCACHRTIFRRRFGFLNHIFSWVVGPFFGHSPESYYVHHMGMHHVEGNLPGDLSSTMKYQRDSWRDFLKYELDFLFLGIPKLLRYMVVRKRTRLVRRLVAGELSFWALVIAATLWNGPAGFTVFVVPLMVTRVLLMTGNWAQHAFLDPEDSTNDYRTVVTFVNSSYNRRGFNDGYHLTHHLKPSLHYLDMPGDFASRQEEMVRMDSLVFRKIDYFEIFLLLMARNHRKLASYTVELDPGNPKTQDEVVALIRRRLRRFEPSELVQYGTAA